MNTIAASASGGSNAGAVVIWVVVIAAYFIPTIVVLFRRSVPSAGSVIVVNVFLGWSVVGWIVALAMAVRSSPQPAPYGMPGQPPEGYR
jgi:hypothetical protein